MQSLPDDDGHVAAPGLGESRGPRGLVALERDECLALLGQHRVGRVAVVDRDDLPFIVPVNYVMVRDTLVFRTDPGTKLDGLRRRPVAFQVDSIDEARRTGWSVLVQGIAHEASPHDLVGADPEPWTEAGSHWVQVVPRCISGRRFERDDGASAR